MNISAGSAPAPVKLRLLPAPQAEPPFEDASEPAYLAVVGQALLPLEWPLPAGVLARGRPSHGLSATPQPGHLRLVGPIHDPEDFGPQPTARAALPEPAPWAARLVQGIAEVLTLDRPLTQLLRWAAPEVYEQLRVLVETGGRRSDAVRGPARRRPTVRSVHVTEPSDGVAEVCAVVDDGRRPRAYALRLEGVDGRWRATALDLI